MPIETPKIEENKEILNEDIAELEAPMRKIFNEMLPQIENMEYDLIIGIDASGRIPTLIMDKLINYTYAKNGNRIKTRFIAGRGAETDARKQIEEWMPKKKVLIVEDTLIEGNATLPIRNALADKGIHFDIAIVSGWFDLDEEKADTLGADNIYWGTTEEVGIYGRNDLSGVIRKQGSTFSEPYKKNSVEDRIYSQDVQKKVNEARGDVDTVSQHLIKWYESRKQ